MSESERVQRWRQRQREAGKEPLTIWLTTTEKLHLEDMALTRHCSPSELVQHALALLRGESPAVTDTVTDTEQIRAMAQQELAQARNITDTVTDTVTATLEQTLPALVRALLAAQHEGSVTATVTDTVTDTVADTDRAPRTKHKAPARHGTVADTVADTITDTDQALEPFDTTKYVLGKLCPRGHAWGNTGKSLLRRTNRHCGACDREKFRERKQAKRQEVSA